jgi:hypothetical protein
MRHVPIAEFKDPISEFIAAAEAGDENIKTFSDRREPLGAHQNSSRNAERGLPRDAPRLGCPRRDRSKWSQDR